MSNEIRIEELWQMVSNFIRQDTPWKARDLLKTIIVISPNHASARAELAAILMAEGDIDLAMLHAAFAYQLNPEIPNLCRRLADLYFMSGFYGQALNCYQKSIRDGDKDRITAERLVLCKNIVSSQGEQDEEH